jgi:hypothetical protein
MAPVSIAVTSQQAPCSQVVNGESYEDQDGEGFVVRDMYYACGCRRIVHEYHDGSVYRKVVHHNGTVLVDELLSEWPV